MQRTDFTHRQANSQANSSKLHESRCSSSTRTWAARLVVSLLAGWVAALASFSVAGVAQTTDAAQTTIVQNDFEDGTLQGWIPRGTAVLANTTEAAHGGTHSLKTTGRTAGFNGPSLNVTNLLQSGTVYQITVWVRLVAGQTADTLKITVQRTVNGSNNFDQVAASSTGGVSDSAWVMLQGTYSFASGPTNLLLYVEAAGATTEYYIDDFSILQVPAVGCSVPQDNTGIHTNFEDGTAEGWRPRIGRETLTVTSADAHSGSFSLLTTGRKAAFDGPAINAAGKLCNGSRYNVSVWAKLAPGQQPAQLRVSIQRTLSGVTNFNTVVGNTTVTADQWVQLKATYDFAFNYNALTLYVESASGTASFYIDDVDVTFVPPLQIEPNIPSVFQSFSDFFPIGAAINPADLSGAHSDLLKKHFNSVTSENDMKWDATERSEGTFSFTTADAEVAYAQANGMRIRGHNLVWHNQIPAWVFQDSSGNPLTPTAANAQLLTQRMINHITALLTHFGTRVYAWDVVNEPIDETQPDCLRRSPWFNIIGPSYIDIAFQTARQVAPDAKLFINDFNTTVQPKRTCLFNLIQGMQQRGIPIDGVGHQMHSNLQFPPVRSLTDTVNIFAGLGIDQQVTEMDISIYTRSSGAPFTDYSQIPNDLLIQQGYLYRDFFQAMRQLEGKISSVTLWGEADDHTFLTSSTRVDAPLLFDPLLQHKFAYTGIIDPLDLPGADLVLTISADSGTVLSGHPVTYTVTVTNKGHDAAANVVVTDLLPAGTIFTSIAAPAGWSCAAPAPGTAGRVSCTTASMDNGATAQLTLVATIVCATPDGTSISNSASVTSSTRNPNPTPTNSGSVAIQVSNPPPVISGLAATPALLWPPNHKMVNVSLAYTITATCDTSIVPVIAVSSNQPVNGIGDGNTSSDWQVVDPNNVLLRAERSGAISGDRIYTITLTATDSAGGVSSGSVTVIVPHDSRN